MLEPQLDGIKDIALEGVNYGMDAHFTRTSVAHVDIYFTSCCLAVDHFKKGYVFSKYETIMLYQVHVYSFVKLYSIFEMSNTRDSH